LQRSRLDGFLITNLINIRYLSGFGGSSAFILITKNKNIFATDFRYQEEAEREFKGSGSGQMDVIHGQNRWEIIIERGNRLKTIKNLIKDFQIRALGFESSASYEFFKGLSYGDLRLKALQGVVEGLRAVKDKEEITLIREAVRRAESSFRDVKPYIRHGRREREIARMLEERLKKRGCNHIPFDIIVASGNNAAMPHARATEKKLSPGDLVVIDWGGEAGGYCSDMTRTLLIRGGDAAKKKEVYQTVLAANRKAIASIKPGVAGRVIDKRARDSIKNAGYDKYFGHGTGHGVGLEVHELPRINRTEKGCVREDMVFTIEPGIYIPGLGGVRIEDMVVVRSEKPEVLTTVSRDLVTI
jgi:Xaa-Pro aminopeptidase